MKHLIGWLCMIPFILVIIGSVGAVAYENYKENPTDFCFILIYLVGFIMFLFGLSGVL